MDIDYKLQAIVLNALKKCYPNGEIKEWLYWFCVEGKNFPTITYDAINYLYTKPKDKETWLHFKNNILYLTEHGLIEKAVTTNGAVAVKATAAGIDFISEDGGLTAVLNRQTVVLDEQTIKQIASVLAQLDKPTLQAFLSQLPSQLSGSLIQALFS